MGWNDHMDDGDEIANLPVDAFSHPADGNGPFEPNDAWLENAEAEEQLIAMKAWFRSRYCDPALETPYNGAEGGYLYINGGPYDPADELPGRFSGVVDDDVIQEAIDDLHGEVGDEWAPVRREPPDDYYDDRFDFDLDVRSEPLRRLDERLGQGRKVLQLQGDSEAQGLAKNLVFAATIGAFEAFLWETMHYWVDKDETVLRNLVTKLPAFRDAPMTLGEIYERLDGIKTHVKGHLQNLVWHRWDKVVPLYRDGLGLTLPSMRPFDDAVLKRHDIVHRSGHTKDGKPVEITDKDIHKLSSEIYAFASKLDEQLSARALSQ